MTLFLEKMKNRGEMRLTERYFFDTDCLSAFLWIRGESILAKLYSGRIILPAQVYEELKFVPHLRQRADDMKAAGDLSVESMEVDSAEYRDYYMMTSSPEEGMRIIGKGEAAGIAMVRARGGILASNNMKDIAAYVEKFGLQLVTTGDILKEAMEKEIITEQEGNLLWQNMLRKRRKLPAASFTEYLENKGFRHP